MKRIVYTLLIVVLLKSGVMAQPPARPANVQGLKIAFITRQLNLSNEDAQRFWPVYYDYSDELRKARSEQKEDIIAFEEQLLNIRKKYKAEFRKILGTEDRANKVMSIDRDFNNVLKKELEDRAQQKKKEN